MKNKALLALLLSFCIFLPALAQTKPAAPQQPQKPGDDQEEVVKITTNLVQVDAVVTKDGKVVTDLTADDFEIYEDGKKQAITNFAFISNVPSGAPPQPVIASKEKTNNIPPPPRPVNPNEPHRTIAFVVDDLGISAESMGQVSRQLRKFVNEQLQPNDLIAIIRTGGEMGALQQFTNDKRILSRAVDQLRWNLCSRVGVSVITPLGSGFSPALCGYSSMTATIRSLRFILDAMSYLPGRKSMVFMSDHLPVEDQDELNFLRGMRNRDKQDPMLRDNDGLSDPGLEARTYSAALHKIAEKAIRSSVVIYGVDTQGLQTTGLTAADRFYGSGQQYANLITNRSLLLRTRSEGSDLIAKQTGGFLIRNSNNYDIDRIMQDQSGYYLLGYRPTDETFNRKFHHIKAKVKRSGMTLRTRLGFFGVTEDEASKTRLTPRDMTNLALASPFAAQDVEVGLSSLFWSEKTTGPLVRSFVYIDAKDLVFTPVDGRQQASIEVHGVVFGDNGALIGQLRRGATVSVSESEHAAALKNGLGLSVDLPVKGNGAFQVRIAIRDRNSSKIGSAGEFVTVPDLKNKRLAVSGIVLANSSGGDQETMSNAVTRRFEANSDLQFGFVIYNVTQFAKPVMETKLFRDGKVVYSGSELPIQVAGMTDPDRVVASSKVHLSPELEPGYYYLQVVITDKDLKNKTLPVVQWIDFEVIRPEPAAAAPGLN